MPYTAQFFAEKLNLPVEYFNPFRNIEIDPTIDLEDLSKYAHSFGEVVGLGLRDLAHCPVELNLMPKSSIQRQEFSQKKPFFIAAIYALALMVFAVWWAEARIVSLRKEKLEQLRTSLGPLKQKAGELKGAMTDTKALQDQANQFGAVGEDREYWARILMELRRVMNQSEIKTKAAMKTNAPNIEIGVWVEEFTPLYPNGTPFVVGAADNPGGGGGGGASPGPLGDARYGLARPAPAPAASTPGTPTGGNPNEISTVTFRCRAVDQPLEEANSALAYRVEDELKSSPYFAPPIQLGTIERKKEESTNTFSFTVTVNLKKPAKL